MIERIVSSVVTYIIRGSGGPVFVENGKVVDFLAPDSEYVQGLANSENVEKRELGVIRISGTVFKVGRDGALVQKNLVISAEKYVSPDFAYSDNEDGSEIRISVPEFQKGRSIGSAPVFKADAPAVTGLRALMEARNAKIAAEIAATLAADAAKAEADAKAKADAEAAPEKAKSAK